MKKFKSLIVLSLLFLCTCPAYTAIIHLNDGQTHNIDYTVSDSVLVDFQMPYTYTTVNLLSGGSVQGYFNAYEHSRINISGGSMLFIGTHDSCQVNMSAGSVNNLNGADSSCVSFSGGSITGLFSQNSSHANISGGTIGDLVCNGSSQITMTGGNVDFFVTYETNRTNISGGYITQLNASGSCQVNISGGELDSYLFVAETGLVDISGGSIESDLFTYDQSRIQIFGFDFAVDGQPFGYGELTSILGGFPSIEPVRHLTGTLLSGELIDNDFYIGHDAKIILIPEPATVFLLGLGGLLIRKKR